MASAPLPPFKGDYAARTRYYWDSIAAEYLSRFRDELCEKPFDRLILTDFAAKLGPGARVCDLGCGPCAHVTNLLANAGLDISGIDLSPVCVDLARGEYPDLKFEVMDAEELQFPEASFDGLVAYYLLHYFPKRVWPTVFAGFARVLRPGGKLLLVMKDGDSDDWIKDPMGGPVDTYWAAAAMEETKHYLQAAKFEVLDAQDRQALPQEIAVDRFYLVATKCAS